MVISYNAIYVIDTVFHLRVGYEVKCYETMDWVMFFDKFVPQSDPFIAIFVKRWHQYPFELVAPYPTVVANLVSRISRNFFPLFHLGLTRSFSDETNF